MLLVYHYLCPDLVLKLLVVAMDKMGPQSNDALESLDPRAKTTSQFRLSDMIRVDDLAHHLLRLQVDS